MAETEHRLSHVNAYEAPPSPPEQLRAETPKRFVAWCSCGVGSPMKATVSEAIDSLEVHLEDPEVLPS